MATPYQHLTFSDRIHIEIEQSKGTSCKDLANMLDKHPTTIARELHRNSDANGHYDAQEAHRLAQTRRVRASSQPRPQTARLWAEFAQALRQYSRKMSPELYYGRTTQVEGRVSLSRSWLYELLHRARQQGGDLYKCLPRQGRKYRKRFPSDASSSKIPNRIDIDQRPPAVDTRNALGHWEMDTIIGHGHQGVLLTVIERYSRLTRILVRRTFRKKQSFLYLTRKAIAVEEQQLNQMPRKCLGFRTPQEVFDTLQAQTPPKK